MSPNYCRRLWMGTLLAIVVEVYILFLNTHRRPNYLYPASYTLDYHRISSLPADHVSEIDRPIVFLGSSSVAGSDVPPDTTLSDCFNREIGRPTSYNLAVMGGNFLHAMTYLRMARPYHPRLAIWGISPDAFTRSGYNPNQVPMYYLEELRPYLPEETYLRLVQMKNSPLYPFLNLQAHFPLIFPTQLNIAYDTLVYGLRERLYGKLAHLNPAELFWNDPDTAEPWASSIQPLIAGVVAVAREMHVPLIAYFTPLNRPEMIFQDSAFRSYRQDAKSALERQGIRYFDYTDLLPPSPAYFFDVFHRSVEGTEILAQRLLIDLKSETKGLALKGLP